jgi:hypothetical protein
MWTTIKETYARSAWIAVTLPLLFALPAVAEMTQHVIEYRIGMFESLDAMVGLSGDPGRMIYGMAKVLSLFLLLYWVSRAMAFGRGGGRRILGDGRSAFLFVWVALVCLILAALPLFAGDLLQPWVADDRMRLKIVLILLVIGGTLNVYLDVWMVGAALGNGRLTIPASFRIMHGNFWWSTIFFLLAQLPLMIAHYGLNYAAAGRSEPVLWTLLTLDAFVVGSLGIVLAAAQFLIARRAAERAGVRLT